MKKKHPKDRRRDLDSIPATEWTDKELVSQIEADFISTEVQRRLAHLHGKVAEERHGRIHMLVYAQQIEHRLRELVKVIDETGYMTPPPDMPDEEKWTLVKHWDRIIEAMVEVRDNVLREEDVPNHYCPVTNTNCERGCGSSCSMILRETEA